MVLQITQIVFAVGIVGSFAALQFGFTRPDSLSYLLVNLAASAGLAVNALLSFQLGFMIINSVWAVVAAAGLATLLRRRRSEELPGDASAS